MPAYNAARTLRRTYEEVDGAGGRRSFIVVDDASHDEDCRNRPHTGSSPCGSAPRNRGYGEIKKPATGRARCGADNRHHDPSRYQYTPVLIPAMASLVPADFNPACWLRAFSRGRVGRLEMPLWKYLANRVLTLAEIFLRERNS